MARVFERGRPPECRREGGRPRAPWGGAVGAPPPWPAAPGPPAGARRPGAHGGPAQRLRRGASLQQQGALLGLQPGERVADAGPEDAAARGDQAAAQGCAGHHGGLLHAQRLQLARAAVLLDKHVLEPDVLLTHSYGPSQRLAFGQPTRRVLLCAPGQAHRVQINGLRHLLHPGRDGHGVQPPRHLCVGLGNGQQADLGHHAGVQYRREHRHQPGGARRGVEEEHLVHELGVAVLQDREEGLEPLENRAPASEQQRRRRLAQVAQLHELDHPALLQAQVVQDHRALLQVRLQEAVQAGLPHRRKGLKVHEARGGQHDR
mmetsp:Transcript_28839/g.75484  ORF Transcript_28839/g.75484 Transcript_28839/m.75484 type:complete len:318 (-) Transcript_28839:514-1467(-)